MNFNETWAGLDVSKAAFDATLLMRTLNGVRELGKSCFSRDEQGVSEFLRWSMARTGGDPIGGRFRLRVAMEATGGYSTGLSKLLKSCGMAVDAEVLPSILNPLQVNHYAKGLGLKTGSDPIDSRAIALFGIERTPPGLHGTGGWKCLSPPLLCHSTMLLLDVDVV